MKKFLFLFLLIISSTSCYARDIKWATFPVRMYFSATFPPRFIPIVIRAGHTWETALNKKLFIFEEDRITGYATKDTKNGLYWESQKPMKATKEGETFIHFIGPQIHEADIVFNPQNFVFSESTPTLTEIDFESLAVHELGHLLGLEHIRQEDSVMHPILFYGVVRRKLNPLDIESIRKLYE